MRILFSLIFLLGSSVFAFSQANRILVIGKGLDDAEPEVVAKIEKDLLSDPAAVLIMGDYLENRHRIDQNFLVNSRLGTLLKNYKGAVYIIPGENEYGPFQLNSIEHLAALEQSVSELDSTWQLLPANGCPGPVEIAINDSFLLVVINTARFLHHGEVIPFAECGQEDEGAVFAQLNDLLEQNPHKPVFVVGHHPFRTRGHHGGYFPWYQHMLPPVLGSVYAGFRKYVGGLQDVKYDRYQTLMAQLHEAMMVHDGIYYISGHDGYFHYDVIDNGIPKSQIIAGAVGDAEYSKPLKKKDESRINLSDFTRISNSPGYVLIDVLNITASPLTFKIAVAYRGIDEDLVSVSFYQGSLPASARPDRDSVFEGQTTDARATLKLHKDSDRPGLLGNNYREEWEAVLHDIPVLDIQEEKGGLNIEKKGGGQQTRSLRLEAEDGKQYVLRSIEKFPEKAVPVNLRNTIAEDIISDQISASHPYGALAIPPLADAAGVYHTNPKLIYLPDDPALGKYREDFANGLYLFEERPDDDHWEDAGFFGNAPDIISTADVVEKMGNDDDHFIMEDQVIRSRLFDFWIGDWDRHDDQWRWARFEDDEDIKHYAPIPRDRDQAFFWSDGTLLKLGSRRWGQPKFQGFHEKIRDIAGMNFNARHFDRTFIIQSELSDWERIASDLQKRLTDEVIESGVKQLPKEIYALHGDVITAKLKARRDDLMSYAKEYYLFLARTVTVTGSNEAERFSVSFLGEDSVRIQKYRVKASSGKIKYLAYDRTFRTGETEEIRLFGREGDDRFVITGSTDRSPLIRIIGGTGKDSISDEGHIRKGGKKIFVYDTPETYVSSSHNIRDKRSSSRQVNQYNRYSFQYDLAMPLITGGFNPDDGVFLGGGVLIRKHGFRKNPYKAEHKILASIAPRSASYSLAYHGDFIDIAGKADLELHVRVDEPSFGDFFYGFGNQTNFNEELFENERQFYRVRYSQWLLEPSLRFNSSNNKHIFRAGPYYRSVKIRREENTQITDRFIIAYSEFVGRGEESPMPLLDNRRHYTGLRLGYDLDLRDSKTFPRLGLFWTNEAHLAFQIGDEAFRHQRLASSVSFYFTFGEGIRATLAGRIGGQANFGDFEFYQAARLGGLSNLRGYRKLRFAGDESFYTNFELRVQVLQIKSVLFPALFGFHVYRDQGRVWSDAPDLPVQNPDKAEWHRGIGGGLWLAPLGTLVISTDYARSNDNEQAFYIRLGFFF